jgi:hypothetical protein
MASTMAANSLACNLPPQPPTKPDLSAALMLTINRALVLQRLESDTEDHSTTAMPYGT